MPFGPGGIATNAGGRQVETVDFRVELKRGRAQPEAVGLTVEPVAARDLGRRAKGSGGRWNLTTGPNGERGIRPDAAEIDGAVFDPGRDGVDRVRKPGTVQYRAGDEAGLLETEEDGAARPQRLQVNSRRQYGNIPPAHPLLVA